MDPFKISFSKISTFRKCHYAYYLRYIEKLQPQKISRSLYFGSDFHRLLEFRGDKDILKSTMKELCINYENQCEPNKAILGETYTDDLKTIFSDYRKVYKKERLPDQTEFSFEVELGELSDGRQLVFNGIIDGLYFDKTGYANSNTIIEEHKTFSVRPHQSVPIMSIQKHLYAKALELLTGYMPKAIMWDYIKSTPSAEPVLLKSGKLSRAKSTVVTPFSWKRACRKYCIDDEETLSYGKNFESNIGNYFFRIRQDINPESANNLYDEFKQTGFFLAENEGKFKNKNCTRDCAWCDFLAICQNEISGSDTDWIKEEFFTSTLRKD